MDTGYPCYSVIVWKNLSSKCNNEKPVALYINIDPCDVAPVVRTCSLNYYCAEVVVNPGPRPKRESLLKDNRHG